jgi:hypothetical protein
MGCLETLKAPIAALDRKEKEGLLWPCGGMIA